MEFIKSPNIIATKINTNHFVYYTYIYLLHLPAPDQNL